MPKKLLTGTLEEQATQLYQIAQERMTAGAYTGALHYLKEIERAVPGYRDVPALIIQVESVKRENTFVLTFSIILAIALIAGSRLLGYTSDLVSIGVGTAGLVAGWFVATILYTPFRRKNDNLKQ